jgi:hypothetical protein
MTKQELADRVAVLTEELAAADRKVVALTVMNEKLREVAEIYLQADNRARRLLNGM